MDRFEHAKMYSKLGWKVIPVYGVKNGKCDCGNDNCTSQGKHPIINNWQSKASADLDQIQQWLTLYPNMNFGIVTGKASNLVVLDIDPRNGGRDSLDEILALHGSLNDHVHVETGGGGYHYYFSYGDLKAFKSGSDFMPGVDVKADGGFIVAPPSGHKSGRDYTFVIDTMPDTNELKPVPSWLIDLVENRKSTDKSQKSIISSENGLINEGSRNQALLSIAGTLRRKGMNKDEIFPLLSAVNQNRCNPPLDESEVESIAKSVCKYDAEDPIVNDSKSSTILSARQRLKDSLELPELKPLLYPFWYETELHFLFARAGTGKSAFCVELANAIANGTGYLGMKGSGTPKSVLFYDLELSEYQFRARYVGDNTNYSFSENLHMAKLDLAALGSNRYGGTLHSSVLAQIRNDIAQTKAEVVMIDNITFISSESQQDANVAMEITKGLLQIKADLNLSILVIGHTPKKKEYTPLTQGDMSGSSNFSNLADSMSAIGKSALDKDLRYLIQLKSRVTEELHGADNVVIMRLGEVNGLLGYRFEGTGAEFEHLKLDNDNLSIPDKLYEAAELYKLGKTYDEIAKQLGISKGTITKWRSKYPDEFR